MFLFIYIMYSPNFIGAKIRPLCLAKITKK